MGQRVSWFVAAALAAAAVGSTMAACVGDDPGAGETSSPDAAPGCTTGTEGCSCTPGGSCDPGLLCASKLCIRIVSDAGAPEGDGDAADATSPSRCGNPFFPEDGAVGPFCPFSQGNIHCPRGAMCCEAASGASDCAGSGASCPAGVLSWECTDSTQCMPGLVCCAQVNAPPTPDPNFPGCATAVALDRAALGRTLCQQECGNFTRVCERETDCPTDKVCKTLRVAGSTFGLCLPP